MGKKVLKPRRRTAPRRRAKPDRAVLRWATAAFALAFAVAATVWLASMLAEKDAPRLVDYVEVLATGYCNCGECCGWELDESGEPVYNYGYMKGRRKTIGETSSGTMAHYGTIAADPRRFKAGTRMYVPDYGFGRVEDVGGAIKGDHIDLWFPSHQEAKEWGSRTVTVRVMTARKGDL